MISVELIKDKNNSIRGFMCDGHAEAAEYGEDIICAAVSALTINTINSIESFTQDDFSLEQDETSGRMVCTFSNLISPESELLIKSLFLGLKNIQKDYGNQYINVKQ